MADCCAQAISEVYTNVAGQNQEVVVGQTAVVLGVKEGLDVDAIALGVFVLDNVKGVLEVEDLLLGENGNLSRHVVGLAMGYNITERKKGQRKR